MAIELAIGNVVRRVLYIIREEHMNALKTPTGIGSPVKDSATHTSAASRTYQHQTSRSLGTILTPGTAEDLNTPIADLKMVQNKTKNSDVD